MALLLALSVTEPCAQNILIAHDGFYGRKGNGSCCLKCIDRRAGRHDSRGRRRGPENSSHSSRASGDARSSLPSCTPSCGGLSSLGVGRMLWVLEHIQVEAYMLTLQPCQGDQSTLLSSAAFTCTGCKRVDAIDENVPVNASARMPGRHTAGCETEVRKSVHVPWMDACRSKQDTASDLQRVVERRDLPSSVRRTQFEPVHRVHDLKIERREPASASSID